MKCAIHYLAVAGTAMLAVASGARAQQGNAPNPAESAATAQVLQNTNRVIYKVAPDEVQPQLRRFLKDNYVLIERGTPPSAPLLVFMPGTSGAPVGVWPVLVAASKAGYRVIGLEYNDEPAVAQICQSSSDPSCSGRFREKRIFGDGRAEGIDDTPEESIVNRLTTLLQYLDAHHPDEQWSRYLANGKPNWERIAVSGHSQGAGMAAFIAKRFLVNRVVLFSCPWDYYGPMRILAPWLKNQSATPPERWYAAYHKREREAATLRRAYEILRIPDDHIRILDLDPNLQRVQGKLDPTVDLYHGSEVSSVITPRNPDGSPAYAPEYAFLFGSPR